MTIIMIIIIIIINGSGSVACLYLCHSLLRWAGSSVGIATDYGLDGPGLNPGGDEIFPTYPDRPWGPHSLL